MKREDVHEVFRYLAERSESDPNLLDDYLRYCDRLMPVVHVARWVSPLVKACFCSRNRRFAFYTTRFKHLIEGLDRGSLLLFGKPQELPDAVKYGISFFPVYDVIPPLFKLFRSDPLLESTKGSELIETVCRILSQLNPEYLVVWNDAMFLERLLIFCCRRVGIRSICIQHGIFHDAFDCRLLDGYYADYMFVWGESQAALYRDPGFDRDKLRILGYPYQVETVRGNSNDKVVCILGENVEITNKEIGLRKKLVYEEIAQMLKNNGYKVVYKPHPYEKDKTYIPSNMNIVTLDLGEAFANYEKFIGLTSTALLEATLNGKIAIQYYDECFGGSEFGLKGFSYMVRNVAEIPSMLDELTVPSTISSAEILLPMNPAQRFLDIVDSLPGR